MCIGLDALFTFQLCDKSIGPFSYETNWLIPEQAATVLEVIKLVAEGSGTAEPRAGFEREKNIDHGSVPFDPFHHFIDKPHLLASLFWFFQHITGPGARTCTQCMFS